MKSNSDHLLGRKLRLLYSLQEQLYGLVLVANENGDNKWVLFSDECMAELKKTALLPIDLRLALHAREYKILKKRYNYKFLKNGTISLLEGIYDNTTQR